MSALIDAVILSLSDMWRIALALIVVGGLYFVWPQITSIVLRVINHCRFR